MENVANTSLTEDLLEKGNESEKEEIPVFDNAYINVDQPFREIE